MERLKKVLNTSVFQKYVVAVSGLGLVGFILMHLLGNLTLYAPSAEPFNKYVQTLYSWGPLLTVAEFGLLGLFLTHIALAIKVTMRNKSAREHKYSAKQTSKEGPSRFNLSSTNMIVTGLVLLVFLVLHIIHFRFGPAIAEGYTTIINGEETRDLYRLVFESFQNPLIVLGYVAVIFFLGFHLRHGFWSAFQSLGAMNPKYSPLITGVGVAFAIIVALGFLFIPIALYFNLTGVPQ